VSVQANSMMVPYVEKATGLISNQTAALGTGRTG
jgi:hypothetical protein